LALPLNTQEQGHLVAWGHFELGTGNSERGTGEGVSGKGGRALGIGVAN